ncbi:MAG TPA: ABC transporter ATP-binding protein [Caulobacteraceae bacterium]|jgi:ABC-type polysaccharide/polyol phosphate transport system ATPase subunit|nr:ABC transporter ATP-binding protein [Caulobacteraceae bacterium]
MSDNVIIRAEGLGKMYEIGRSAERQRYTALRDVLAGGTRNAGRRIRDFARGHAPLTKPRTEAFWALKDVDFDIRQGEVVGVIGRNGAGKSTLLKILSRITEPSQGRVTIDGRVASLLEVGTGFHPELTGRENVYLNGAILGMTRGEIRRKFDEIVDFAAVERFIDTPVKRYSSGMYVRLAFAVAAHLEPEILVIDEVLAVGDVEFQKKCLGKMKEVSSHGRTVLFVSHNLAAVSALCSTSLVFDRGNLAFQGPVSSAIDTYLCLSTDDGESCLPAGNSAITIRSCTINTTAAGVEPLSSRDPLRIDIEIEQLVNIRGARYVFSFYRPDEALAFAVAWHVPLAAGENSGERYRVTLNLPPETFNYGSYRLDIRCARPRVEMILPNTTVCHLNFIGEHRHGSTVYEDWPGAMLPRCDLDVLVH